MEDGGLNGFFEYEDDEELYEDEEYAEYDESSPRKLRGFVSSWVL